MLRCKAGNERSTTKDMMRMRCEQRYAKITVWKRRSRNFKKDACVQAIFVIYSSEGYLEAPCGRAGFEQVPLTTWHHHAFRHLGNCLNEDYNVCLQRSKTPSSTVLRKQQRLDFIPTPAHLSNLGDINKSTALIFLPTDLIIRFHVGRPDAGILCGWDTRPWSPVPSFLLRM